MIQSLPQGVCVCVCVCVLSQLQERVVIHNYLEQLTANGSKHKIEQKGHLKGAEG